MTDAAREGLHSSLGLFYLAHPWHGIAPGDGTADRLTVYVEMVPTDTVKYEVDKVSGHLKIDRPQKYSALCPTLYGFVPRTLCAERVARVAAERTGRAGVVGDDDPIDVCVLAERPVNHAGILVTARPVGGLRMFDGAAADDKILAVLEGDPAYGAFRDIGDCPMGLVERLRHYFLAYKDMPDAHAHQTEITDVYGAEEARHIVRCAMEDYRSRFGRPGSVAGEA